MIDENEAAEPVAEAAKPDVVAEVVPAAAPVADVAPDVVAAPAAAEPSHPAYAGIKGIESRLDELSHTPQVLLAWLKRELAAVRALF